jgi:hypothetical protein
MSALSQARHPWTGLLIVVIVVLLAGVGVLSWRLTDVSRKLDALASATTASTPVAPTTSITEATPPLTATTTTVDAEYFDEMNTFILAHKQDRQDLAKTPLLDSEHWMTFLGLELGGLDKALDTPQALMPYQQKYRSALYEAILARRVYAGSPSQANKAWVFEAATNEAILFHELEMAVNAAQ